jgi:hypothetical protein
MFIPGRVNVSSHAEPGRSSTRIQRTPRAAACTVRLEKHGVCIANPYGSTHEHSPDVSFSVMLRRVTMKLYSGLLTIS